MAMGYLQIWSDPIIDLPWFGQAPGYPGEGYYGPGFTQYYGYPAYATQMPSGSIVTVGGQTVRQMPGHSLVIRPGVNGAPAEIQQVPGVIQSM